MIKLIRSLPALFLITVSLACCSSSRKNNSELRGLMLLENTQLGRNKGYYSKHGAKKITTAHKKVMNQKRHKKFQ